MSIAADASETYCGRCRAWVEDPHECAAGPRVVLDDEDFQARTSLRGVPAASRAADTDALPVPSAQSEEGTSSSAALAPRAAPALPTIERVKALLAECLTVDEARDIRDQAAAVTAYYRERADSLEIQNYAASVRLRAERRLGELLRAMPKNRGAAAPRDAVPGGNRVPTLDEIGISKKEASVWQRIAALAEEDFEGRLAEAQENGLELTTSRVLRGPPPAEMQRPRPEPEKREAPAVAAPQPERLPAPGGNDDLLRAAQDAAQRAYVEWDEAESYEPFIEWARGFVAHVEGLERARVAKAAR